MNKLLKLLSRAFDTKGYPDDKNPENWRKINGSPVHLDANGNIDGGAGGKFTGNTWSSTKHQHKPKAITKADLDGAWKNLVKYKKSMSQAKTQKTYEKNAANMKSALEEYKKMASLAPTSMQKHNVASMEEYAGMQYKSASPLEGLASVGKTKVEPKIKNEEKGFTSKNVSKLMNLVWGKQSAENFLEAQMLVSKGVTSTNYEKLSSKIKNDLAYDNGVEEFELSIAVEDLEYMAKQAQNGTGSVSVGVPSAEEYDYPTPNNLLSELASAVSYPVIKFKEKSLAYWDRVKVMTPKEADARLFSLTSKIWKSASQAERHAAFHYTWDYIAFNGPLRKNKISDSAKVEINNLTDMINRSELPCDMVLNRGCRYAGMDNFFGVSLDVLEHASDSELQRLVGNKVFDSAFLSTGCASGKGYTDAGEFPVQLKIYAPKGTKGLYAEPFSDFGENSHDEDWDGEKYTDDIGEEQEVILQRSTNMEVLSAKRVGGVLKVELQIIKQNPQYIE